MSIGGKWHSHTILHFSTFASNFFKQVNKMLENTGKDLIFVKHVIPIPQIL